jgi:hypothetical protein
MHNLSWDGVYENGQIARNGMYLYKITIEYAGGRAQFTGKLFTSN